MSDLETIILQELLTASPEYVSGEAVAERLDLSRVSIRSRFEKMRQEGFDFEAVRNRGYRIKHEPPTLHSSLLNAYLALKHVSVPVLFLETVDSTNSEAERQLAQGCDTPSVVVSTRQTEGRGRMGRVWFSDIDKNIYMSFIFRPQLPPDKMKKFTLWMGLTVCEFVNDTYAAPVQIKWPNDLVCEGKKVAGILTEARVDSDHTRDLIFGIGLNVNTRPNQWPTGIAGIATSFSEICGESLNINEFAASMIQVLLQGYDAFIADDYEDKLIRSWGDYDSLQGRTITAKTAQGIVTGYGAGIDAEGALVIEQANGTKQIVHAGDVSLTMKGVS